MGFIAPARHFNIHALVGGAAPFPFRICDSEKTVFLQRPERKLSVSVGKTPASGERLKFSVPIARYLGRDNGGIGIGNEPDGQSQRIRVGGIGAVFQRKNEGSSVFVAELMARDGGDLRRLRPAARGKFRLFEPDRDIGGVRERLPEQYLHV
jgi:hypothetical protein